ncbi:MAG: hypothetical protein EP326_05600 [Deltaproteobacteria bacterium]|nr:MAG: hypothetical protein EP326_05600 [Deltaproteobacteria bacterium]
MKNLLALTLLFCFNAFGNETFLDYVKEKSIKLAYDDGDVHTITFSENEFGIVTGNYADENGKQVIGMPVKFVIDDGIEYMRLYKDRHSPVGTYKYAMYVFIPTQFTPGESTAYVDARWGHYKRPLFFIVD